MNTEETTTQPNEQRDGKGRFTAGNPGGPGNPFARQVAKLRQALIDAVTPQDIQKVAAKLIELAAEGNVQAAKLLLTYVIGKPQPAPEPDRMDADEWDLYRETTPMKEESPVVMAAGVPESHLAYVRALRPIYSQIAHEQVMEILNEDPAEREAREEQEDIADAQHRKEWMESPEGQAFAAAVLAPSPNGGNGQRQPSPNGGNGQPHPSTNGGNGQPHPSTNGQKRRSEASVGAPRPF
jgi:hypothetical protein